MTKEQIADVRRRIDLSPGAITEPMVRNAELARLLDEHEALLEALRKAVLFLHAGVTFGDMDAARRQAEVAIAKAEAP